MIVSPTLTDWITPERAIEWTRDVRQRTFDIVADLDEEQLLGPRLSIVNPLLWEIGHQAWFQEKWVLRHVAGREPIRPDADALWDSIAIPHDDRWELPLPDREGTYRYMEDVREAVCELLDSDPTPEALYFALYCVYHEDMHTEAFTYTRQTYGWSPPKLHGGPAPEPGADERISGDVEIGGGTFELGAPRDAPFVFDNEKWAHPVEVEPFAISRTAVTQADFAAFVADDGYQRPELWDPEGWAWREMEGATMPVYWRRSGDTFERRHFDEWRSLEPSLPVIHVNWYEADAYARWAGRRLPTEAEWEVAASTAPADGGFSDEKRRWPWGDDLPSPQQANMDGFALDASGVGAHAPGDSPHGVRQMMGNVWEWTSTLFGPYPGFEPDPYEEYSEPWFTEGRRILRGGAWPTRARMLRTTWRNYFTPERRDVYAGLRTCAPRS